MQSEKRIKKKRAHSADKRGFADRLHEVLDVPLECISPISLVEVKGTRQVVVSGCAGVLEYGTDSILIRVQEGQICITGHGLEMQSLIEDCITVRGKIHAVYLNQSSSSEDKEG